MTVRETIIKLLDYDMDMEVITMASDYSKYLYQEDFSLGHFRVDVHGTLIKDIEEKKSLLIG